MSTSRVTWLNRLPSNRPVGGSSLRTGSLARRDRVIFRVNHDATPGPWGCYSRRVKQRMFAGAVFSLMISRIRMFSHSLMPQLFIIIHGFPRMIRSFSQPPSQGAIPPRLSGCSKKLMEVCHKIVILLTCDCHLVVLFSFLQLYN